MGGMQIWLQEGQVKVRGRIFLKDTEVFWSAAK